MNLSLAAAILDTNLKGPTATLDQHGLSVVRWAWETARATLPTSSDPQSGEAVQASSAQDELLSQSGGGDGWRPIETAPRDGSDVILSNGYWAFEATSLPDGRFIRTKDRQETAPSNCRWWMPLPVGLFNLPAAPHPQEGSARSQPGCAASPATSDAEPSAEGE
jgi:hypothetical protein